MPIRIEDIDRVKSDLRAAVAEFARRHTGTVHADVRIEVEESQWASAECGEARMAEKDSESNLGVRVLARGAGSFRGTVAAGYYGVRLGPADWTDACGVVRRALGRAWRRARENAGRKAEARASFGAAGLSLSSTELAPAPVSEANIPATYRRDPREVRLAEVTELAVAASREAQGTDPAVRYTHAAAATALRRQLFLSAAGACIDQAWALTEGNAYVVAEEKEVTQEIYDTLGSNLGWEVIGEGVDNGIEKLPDFLAFVRGLARDAVELCRAPKVPASEKPVVVLTDPHYNTLLVHEIVGHPVELDRALKMETAYAGRTWLFGSPKAHHLGDRIASEKLSAYSDPSLPGYGHYAYDDEGVPAARVVHIDRGIFSGFMNSRQTSAMLGAAGIASPPNGHYKATAATMVPLIRMSTTVFAAGTDDPAAMLSEVERGFYLVGHKIPSISESRENFRISARKVYEIRDGKLGQLYRDGGLTADSREFFMNVDAVGSDFRVFPIPNCGKGQPMQTKRLGNGGPTLRSRARIL
ncbi:MAG: TldD/PmbA family protein [Nitrospirae bacterium]|nr:TldD/PmbA family protein [Nitrospirota bacterium]